jgi:hypothetical protein
VQTDTPEKKFLANPIIFSYAGGAYQFIFSLQIGASCP